MSFHKILSWDLAKSPTGALGLLFNTSSVHHPKNPPSPHSLELPLERVLQGGIDVLKQEFWVQSKDLISTRRKEPPPPPTQLHKQNQVWHTSPTHTPLYFQRENSPPHTHPMEFSDSFEKVQWIESLPSKQMVPNSIWCHRTKHNSDLLPASPIITSDLWSHLWFRFEYNKGATLDALVTKM